MKSNYILIVSFFIVLTACELVIDIEQPDFQSSLVVQSVPNNQEDIWLFLSQDYYILDRKLDEYNQTHGVSGAEIELFEDGQSLGSFTELILEKNFDESPVYGFYSINYRPLPGKSYSIQASKQGFRTVSATTQLPTTSVDFEIGNIEEAENEWGGTEYRMEITIHDQPGEHYYEIDIVQNTFEPVYDPFGNLEDFKPVTYPAYVYTDNLIVSEYLYDHLLFPDDLFEGGSYTLTLVFEVGDLDYLKRELGLTEDSHALIHVRNCTRDYFDYYNSASLQNWNNGDPFAEPVPIYTNISGGQGLFGAYNTQIDTLFSY